MYYIFDCNKEKYFTLSMSELYHFVNSEGTVFGNFPQQRREFKKKILTYGVWWNENMGLRLIKYIVYDEYMNLVDYEILDNFALKNRGRDHKQFRRSSFGNHEFRRGPVRWTGGSRYRLYNYFRGPKTTAELRANCDPDYEQYVRPRRKIIPTECYDVRRSDRDIKRSWKKNKKRKQWM